ncbi:MAG: signal recognition particle-docking protein FtsY [Betaproteobacteria bacterium]|nr:signal recognition particle-docking protein FtsY [Betaproteobacteria bacterium]
MFPLGSKKKTVDAPASDWASRLRRGLALSGERLKQAVQVFRSHPSIDEALYEALEAQLLASDVGVRATADLVAALRKAARDKRLKDASELEAELRDALAALLAPLERPLAESRPKPFVILLAGVNGAGKTTTIAKLTRLFQSQGLSVLLAAGDTFRAAAREQLQAWGERHGVTVVSQEGGDSAAVIFDAIRSAHAKGIDVVLADTAGRLPTQLHLMEEIRKVKRVIAKADPGAPHETWLVLDANTGQNAVAQVRAFDGALALTGLIVTKLDGTAKGGALAAIAREHPVPVRFIGIGEQPDDLRPFAAAEFVDALFG